MYIVLTIFLSIFSCTNNEIEMSNTVVPAEIVELEPLPIRTGERPETTPIIPHVQIDVELVPKVHEEMIRRIYTIPGVEEHPSAILSWRGLWLDTTVPIVQPEAFISGWEFGHIHDDGSLHIFLEPQRATEAIEAGWAVAHPYAVEGREGWDGFVMLYTPQSIEDLNVTFQLIVETYNYITGKNLLATDYYN